MRRTLFVPVAVLVLLASCFLTAFAFATTDLFKDEYRIAMEVERERQAAVLQVRQAEEERPFYTIVMAGGILVACGLIVC